MDPSQRCNYVYPEGMILVGECRAPVVEGSTRCILHQPNEQEEIFHLPAHLMDEMTDDEIGPADRWFAVANVPALDAVAAAPIAPILPPVADDDLPEVPMIPLEDIIDMDMVLDDVEDLPRVPVNTEVDPEEERDADGDVEFEAGPVFGIRAPQVPDPEDEPLPDGHGEDCNICLETVGVYQVETLEKEYPKRTPCGHLFGAFCLFKWIVERENPSCPMCRAPLDLDILVPAWDANAESNCLTTELKTTGEREADDAIIDEGVLYGIDTSRGCFTYEFQVHRIPRLPHSRRYFATFLTTLDGRQQLATDNETVFNEPVWFPTPNIMRPIDTYSETDNRIVTNMLDNSQCWEIMPGQTHITLTDRRVRIPAEANFIVLTRDGKFLRWAQSYNRWLQGF